MRASAWRGSPIFSDSKLSALDWWTLFYLGLPWLIFLTTWLRPVVGLPVLLVLACGLVHEFRSRMAGDTAGSRVQNLLLVFLAVLWWAFSGVGGYGWQTSDWHQHNLKLTALIVNHWPVYLWELGNDKIAPTLVYPIGFYLPTGAVAKLFHWKVANHFLIVYTITGLTLVFFWLRRILGKYALVGILVFPLLGGLDWIGWWIMKGKTEWPGHIEWWAYIPYLQLTGNSALLSYVPQHAIPGWLGAAWILYRSDAHGSIPWMGVLVAMILLWSPFVALGLVPLALFGAYKSRWAGLSHYSNTVIAPCLAAIALIYYSASAFKFPFEVFPLLTGGRTIGILLLFYLLEFGIYASICRPEEGDRPPILKPWWTLALACLLVLPLFRFGDYNDLLMRGSIPALFIFWIFILRYLLNYRNHVSRTAILGLALMVGSVSSLIELSRFDQLVSSGHWANRYRQHISHLDPQYHGREDGFFYRYLAKPGYRPNVAEPGQFRNLPCSLVGEHTDDCIDENTLVPMQ